MQKLATTIPMEQIVSRQFRLWERAYEKGKIGAENGIKNPCITISKEEGTRGLEFAQRLSDRLGWKLFDKNLVEHIANNAHVRKTMVEIFDGRVQSAIDNWVITLMDKYALGSDKYYKHLLTVMLGISEHGCAIILGRGGNFILPSAKTLKLKLTTSRIKKLLNLVQDKHIAKKEAEKILQETDKERIDFIRRFFHQNADDPSFYDLVLNLDHLSFSAAEELVIHALKFKFPSTVIT